MSDYVLSVDADLSLDDIVEVHLRQTALTPPTDAYLIVYRAGPRPIEIVAVTQGSRDAPAFLRGRITH